MVADMDFEGIVNSYYRPLYQFALSLAHTEAEACDLTQQTFYIWQTKGHQLREKDKVKTWLFTTLYREYLHTQRRQQRFPHFALEQVDAELPTVPAHSWHDLDTATVLEGLAKVDEPYQAALALFYLEDYSYKEIAAIVGVPIGTVKSRLSRGIVQLQQLLCDAETTKDTVKRGNHE